MSRPAFRRAVSPGEVRSPLRLGAGRGPNFALPALIAASAALVAVTLWTPRPRLIWNVSKSAPPGLYWVSHAVAPLPGDYVAARLSPDMGEFAARRHYLPHGLPLIKQVAAAPGDEICIRGDRVTLFGRLVAGRRAADLAGRPLPWWSGCRRLGAGEVLLMNPANPSSFDGRYFGPTPRTHLIGKATLLWAR